MDDAEEQRRLAEMEQQMIEERLRQQLLESEEDSRWLAEEESNFKKRLSSSDRSDTESMDGSVGGISSGISTQGSPITVDPTGGGLMGLLSSTVGYNGLPENAHYPPHHPQHYLPPPPLNNGCPLYSKPLTGAKPNKAVSHTQKVEPTPTADLDRTNDVVYDCTTSVVKAVMQLSQGVQSSRANDYLELVKKVGFDLRALLASVDQVITLFPPDLHREIEMAHKVLSKDMAELVNAMKLAQKYSTTTLDAEYRRGMLSAAHILAMDAKNLLDAVDSARMKSIKMASAFSQSPPPPLSSVVLPPPPSYSSLNQDGGLHGANLDCGSGNGGPSSPELPFPPPPPPLLTGEEDEEEDAGIGRDFVSDELLRQVATS